MKRARKVRRGAVKLATPRTQAEREATPPRPKGEGTTARGKCRRTSSNVTDRIREARKSQLRFARRKKCLRVWMRYRSC